MSEKEKETPSFDQTDKDALWIEPVATSLPLDLAPFFSLFETNILKYPIAFPQKSKVGTHKIIEIEIKTQHGTGFWRVAPNVELGAAGPFDSEVFAAINKIISDAPKPLSNPIPIGSRRAIARCMGYADHEVSGKLIDSIKTSIERLNGLKITQELLYYDKTARRPRSAGEDDQKKRRKKGGSQEVHFHLITRVVFAENSYIDDDGKTQYADTTLIWLDPVYLANINAKYVSPVDFHFYIKLKSVTARSLYMILIIMFFANRNNPNPCYFLYSSLCERLLLDKRGFLSLAKQQLDEAHNELKEAGFLAHYLWEPAKNTKKDWIIKYWPGQKAEAHISATPATAQRVSVGTDRGQSLLGDEHTIDLSPSKQGDKDLFQTTQGATSQDCKEIEAYYIQRFSERFGTPRIQPREHLILAQLAATYPEAKLKALIDCFFRSQDRFVVNGGYTITVFNYVINKLLVELANEPGKKERGRTGESEKKAEYDRYLDTIYEETIAQISQDDQVQIRTEIMTNLRKSLNIIPTGPAVEAQFFAEIVKRGNALEYDDWLHTS